MNIRIYRILICLIIVLDVSAQDRLTVIKAKALVDVRNGQLITPAIIYSRQGKIEKIDSSPNIPADAIIIDLGAKYLLPGLVDAHSHLCHEYQYELEKVPGANIVTETAITDNATRALIGARNARDMLLAGYTTVRDLGNSGENTDVALRDAISKNWLPGPRIYAATRALAPIGGQFSKMTADARKVLVPKEYIEISGVDEARKAVREAIFNGADCIKVIVNNNQLSLNQEELTAIVQEAKAANLKVAAHATNGDQPALNAINAGVNSIEHGYTLSAPVLKLMAEKGIFLVPTDRTGVTRYQQRIKRALEAGVKIAFGSDMYYYDAQRNRGEVTASTYHAYTQSGMSNMQVLSSATMIPGELVAGPGKIGLLEPGYSADIIAVDEDPLKKIETVERVVFVMKEGKVINRRD
ncbi:amidohydrolase family protein [Dyadobacter sp. CY261]|uniref:amidohydrolase family protein n=1 Tax=Dyadobacter sp. CY261 TaxID=2907203 RepID=UPI001F3AD7E1|nr:amidohydrolase family protein [Dyadobacter sp. CY261]MCF0075703.1 amidohydrolase family protein [Dyadobacter sp. CY261]